MHWLFSIILTLLTLLVTAIGFQMAFGVSGFWTIPVVIILGFFPFGRIAKLVLLAIGLWYLFQHGVDIAQIKAMFQLKQK